LAHENRQEQMKHYNLTITGKVHRVGFRFTAMEAAYRCSVNGFVMNSGKNTVSVEAEGTIENLDLFLAWCRKGPLGAKVENVEVQEGPLKNFTRFEILDGL
jgi:acylphosphatase